MPEENSQVDHKLAGYRLHGEWFDVEDGAPLPVGSEWLELTQVTLNLNPNDAYGDEPYYRSAKLIGGIDHPDGDYTLQDLANNLRIQSPPGGYRSFQLPPQPPRAPTPKRETLADRAAKVGIPAFAPSPA